MKRFKSRKRLLTLLLTSTIVITSSGCGIKIVKGENTNKSPERLPAVIATAAVQSIDPTPEPTPEPTEESIGEVEIYEPAIRVLNTENGYSLVRFKDHLELLEGDLAKTENSNPLYPYKKEAGKGTTTDSVNFRLSPTTEEDNKIDTLNSNVNVNVYGKTEDNWYLVEYDGTLGFIKGDYLRIMKYEVDDDYELNENTIQVVPAVQATTNVKIRKEANENSLQLDLLRKNDSIKMIELLPNGWYAVEYKGDVAYICGDYVRETIMVEGNYYKVIYLKNDAEIYDAPNGNVTGFVPEYASGEVYCADNGYYLVATSDKQVGYIKESDTGTLTDTAVVIDIGTQTLKVYSDNKIVFISPIVSGKATEERHSDIGIFTIQSKETDKILKDEARTYESHVDYWMNYNNGEGLHDADWRDRFGGDIYIKNGSHGCINLPPEKAKELYGIVSVGDNVLVGFPAARKK